MTTQEREKARRKLDNLSTWTPEQLDEELATWAPEKVNDLWKLLEKPYRLMCRGFGLASARQKVSARGIYTHQQIKRIAVLQRHAERSVA